MIAIINEKSVPAILLILTLSWLPGWPGQALWVAQAGNVPAAAESPDRNPFSYPPRILKEMALKPGGDGKTPATAKPPQKEYALTGILWTDRGGVASINQHILQEGEKLDDYRVFRIDRNRVILKKEGEEIVLNLFQSPVVISEQREPRSTQKKKFP